MIARHWTARTTPAQAAAYAEYLQSHVIPQLRTIDGYRGARLLQRPLGQEVELVVVTMWQSLDAVRAFAGADHEAAVVTKQAAALLSGYDPRVRHFDVVAVDEEP